MTEMRTRTADSVRWDLVSLGEVMLRLDPGERRIHTTRSFDVWEGGGEYNVARGLRRCFGLRTAVATAFVDNPANSVGNTFAYGNPFSLRRASQVTPQRPRTAGVELTRTF